MKMRMTCCLWSVFYCCCVLSVVGGVSDHQVDSGHRHSVVRREHWFPVVRGGGGRMRSVRQVAGNIDAALRNPSFVRFQLSCLLDRGACDRIGQRIKSLLPEMVATGQCSQCSPQEIGQAGKVIVFIQDHYPIEYDLLEKKFMQDAELQEEEEDRRAAAIAA